VRKDLLQSAQAVVSAGLIGEGVKVVFDAEVPHADLKNRVMHLRPLPEEVSEEALLHLRADCDHEMGHFGFTDPKALEPITRQIVKLIANAIEDGFIEKKVSERWLGCSQNLAASNAQLRAEIRAKFTGALPPEERENGRRALAINGLQMLTFGQSLDEVYATFGRSFEKLYEPVADLLPKLPLVAHTRDSVTLATEFADRWRWGKPEPPVLPIPVPGKPESEWRREDKVARKLEPHIVGAQRKAAIAEQPFTDHYRYRAYTNEDVVEDLAPVTDPALVARFVNSVRHVVPPLRRRLIMEFSGRGHRFLANQKRGEFDQRAAHRVALGSERVFRQKLPEIVLDADVSLLVDASGSMHGDRIHIAAQAACAFSMVLDLLDVPHEAGAFTTTTELPTRLRLYDWQEHYERIRPLRHLVVKPAALTFRQCRGRFAALAGHQLLIENCDGESVMWAAQRLKARARPGMMPILIVFSDGLPCSSPEDARVLAQHLKRTIERVEAAGITCIGVGIVSEWVKHFYRHHAVIKNVTDLVETAYDVVRDALRAARRRA